jgi:sensor c-di-GMP phosphodiesterase-like protein
MSLNVSVRQLMHGGLAQLVGDALAAEGVPPQQVYLEVTESVLLSGNAVRELERVRSLGVKVSIDDFGTGYSSLAYLKQLPVDTVKIDKGFIDALGSDHTADRIFAAIVDLAHTLGLATVAEGCELEAQWDVISASGCHAFQGWLISPALAPEAMAPIFEAYLD